MTADANHTPWTLDEFVTLLNEKAPLPQGEDGRRAAAWTPRLLRHYASVKTISAPEKRGRQAYYGERHLEEAQRLTTLQQAGVTSKTAAWIMESQSGSQPSDAEPGADFASFSSAPSGFSESASFLSSASFGGQKGARRGFDAGGSMAAPARLELCEQTDEAQANSAEAAGEGERSLESALDLEQNSLSRSARGLSAGASLPANLMSMSFCASAPLAPSDLTAQAQAAQTTSTAAIGGSQLTSQQKTALDLLNGFQKRGCSQPAANAKPAFKNPVAAIGALAQKQAQDDQPWKKWSPLEGVEMTLREDLWPFEASLKAALEEWAKKLPGAS